MVKLQTKEKAKAKIQVCITDCRQATMASGEQ